VAHRRIADLPPQGAVEPAQGEVEPRRLVLDAVLDAGLDVGHPLAGHDATDRPVAAVAG
jgi:hypothetical protein